MADSHHVRQIESYIVHIAYICLSFVTHDSDHYLAFVCHPKL